jgi:hypothetical protein
MTTTVSIDANVDVSVSASFGSAVVLHVILSKDGRTAWQHNLFGDYAYERQCARVGFLTWDLIRSGVTRREVWEVIDRLRELAEAHGANTLADVCEKENDSVVFPHLNAGERLSLFPGGDD